MNAKTVARASIITLAAASAAACRDEVPTSSVRPPAISAAPTVGIVDTTWFDGESEFRAISKVIPEFAGFYFDDAGRLVVQLTDPGKVAAVSPLLRQFTSQRVIDQRRNLYGAQAPIVTRGATYSFDQLRSWRDAVVAAADRIPAISQIDLDEVRNRVAIGVRRGSDQAAVLNSLNQLMIPTNAVVLEEVEQILDVGTTTGSPSRMVSLAPGDSLTSYNSVVKGGMFIMYQRLACWPTNCAPGSIQPGPKGCTFGLGVRYLFPSENGFLTASHCSENPGPPGVATVYHQNLIAGAANVIGYEFDDPPFTSCAGGHSCKNSDALFALWDGAATARSSFAKIARTTFVGTPYGSLSALGSVAIDQANPEFTVTGETGSPAVGEAADKMGPFDGWTGGPITKTCVTHIVFIKTFNPPTEYRNLCQVEASYNRAPSESGAPVFKFLGTNNVLLMGLHTGATQYNPPSGPTYANYTPITRIRMDLTQGLVTF